MQAHYSQDILGPAGTGNAQSISDTRNGFTAGAGIEYGLTENLSAHSNTISSISAPRPTISSADAGLDQVAPPELTFGLNYRFNWASGTAYWYVR